MSTKKLDFTKPLKTRSGRDVVVYCTDAPGEYPVHGRIGENPLCWTTGGAFVSGAHNVLDLVQVPTKITLSGYVNIYKRYSDGRPDFGDVTLKPKTETPQPHCIAYNVPITVETEEGFGL